MAVESEGNTLCEIVGLNLSLSDFRTRQKLSFVGSLSDGIHYLCTLQ